MAAATRRLATQAACAVSVAVGLLGLLLGLPLPVLAQLPDPPQRLPPIDEATIAETEELPLAVTEADPWESSAFQPAYVGDQWQFLPTGLIYPSYLAGGREPRIGIVINDNKDMGSGYDAAVGARLAVLRYGTTDAIRPEGWQLDFETAVFPRIDKDEDLDVVGTDYRWGIPLTYGAGPWTTKLAFYHISSHLGDEFMIGHPGFVRINYVRDAIVLGAARYWGDSVRTYGEAGWAYNTDGGSEPWEFQFGAEFSPLDAAGPRGSPFAAINSRLREEVDFGGNLIVQAGWQWRGFGPTGLVRAGVQYFNGKSDQYQFFRESEEQIGVGFWYDY